MPRIKAISGLGRKSPAAFLLEIKGKRILFDLGEGPRRGVFPDVSTVGPVDALCLSHAHIDHVGALHLLPDLGFPTVYATQMTLDLLSPPLKIFNDSVVLPPKGETSIAGLPFIVGRTGHAAGGIWLHTPFAGGITYMGDWSPESTLLPFDPPPVAATLITDASYGDRVDSLSTQITVLAEAARDKGAVCCVPAGGRGPEMALRFWQMGLRPLVCPQVRTEMEALAQNRNETITTDSQKLLRYFLADIPSARDWPSDAIIIATEANADSGLAAELLERNEGHHFIFTGHVPEGAPSAQLLAKGKARWFGWNVHPRGKDNIWLAEKTKARNILPAFRELDDMPDLLVALGARAKTKHLLDIAP